MIKEPCICGYKKTFALCCGRFLTEGQRAKTPEQMMRSRYAAYALGGFGDYLLSTWWPANTRGLTAQALSEKNLDWFGLDVISRTQTGDRATVEFIAHYRDNNQNPNHKQSLHERSLFRRDNGRWFYVSGEMIPASQSDTS